MVHTDAAYGWEHNIRIEVFRYRTLKLYHYHGFTKNRSAIPLLIVFATVNRPEVLDLIPEQSFIHFLLSAGFDVYMIDWGDPTPKDKTICFSDYVTIYLNKSVDYILNVTKRTQLDLLGICQGGLISLCYAAGAKTIRRLILLSTPIDFHTHDHQIGHLIRSSQFDTSLFKENIPGLLLTQFFLSLKPAELGLKKMQNFYHLHTDDLRRKKFFRLEQWLYNGRDQTLAAFREFIDDFYLKNQLVRGCKRIAKNVVDLSTLNLPVLNIMAKEDHIVPMSSTMALRRFVDKVNYAEKIYPTGHIGLYVREKTTQQLVCDISEWIKN